MTRVFRSALACVLLLTGCVSVGTQQLTDEATVGLIRVGETKKDQVFSLLGLPEDERRIEMAQSTRVWWRYTYASAVINPLDYLLLYGFWTNGIGTFDHRYDFSLSFDDNDIVSSLSLVTTSYDLGGPMTHIHVRSNRDMSVGRGGPLGGRVRFVDTMTYRE